MCYLGTAATRAFRTPCRFAVAVIIQINTGHEIKTLDDPYLEIANEVGKTLTGGGPPGATGVDILPLRECQITVSYSMLTMTPS